MDLHYSIGEALGTDYVGLREPFTAQQESYLVRTREFVDAEVLPVINGYWERAEFPWPLIEKMSALGIIGDGAVAPKFLADVEQRTFSGPYAAAAGQPVLYVTERCVFQLTPTAWNSPRSPRGWTSRRTSSPTSGSSPSSVANRS